MKLNVKKRANRGKCIEANMKLPECVLIEDMVRNALNGQGQLEFTRSPYYTPREAATPAEINIKTDRMEVMREAINIVGKKYYEDRANRNKSQEAKGEEAAQAE